MFGRYSSQHKRLGRSGQRLRPHCGVGHRGHGCRESSAGACATRHVGLLLVARCRLAGAMVVCARLRRGMRHSSAARHQDGGEEHRQSDKQGGYEPEHAGWK